MKILRKVAIGAALIAGSSALASAQPFPHRDGGPRDRDRGRVVVRERDDRRFVRDDRRFYGDRDDWRFRGGFVDHDRFFVGQSRFYNGFYWIWDGYRWCRHERGLTFYLNF